MNADGSDVRQLTHAAGADAPEPEPAVPSRPTLNVSGGDMTISANWSANDNGSRITSWEVDDGDLSGGPSVTGRGYIWSNVARGNYQIGVRACNAAGCGAHGSGSVVLGTHVYDGNHDVECWSSLGDEPYWRGTFHWPSSSFWTRGCWFGFPGEQVWVVVGGVKSNVVRWNR